MSPKPIRVAIYLRVSKDDGSQETDNQLLQLREFCGRWDGHELVAEYLDRESGTRGRRERKDFDRMFAEAARRRFDVLLFWALDRFSREGIRKTIAYLERLDACGVAFKSYTEPFLDTDNEPIAHIVLGVTSYYAQQEALRISDRTKAGLERARRNGKVLGRPDGFERWAPEAPLRGRGRREAHEARGDEDVRLGRRRPYLPAGSKRPIDSEGGT